MRISRLIAAAAMALVFSLAAGQAMADTYPEEVRADFLDECKAKAPEAHCSCILGKLEAEVPIDQVLQNTVPDETLDKFATACLGEVKLEGERWPGAVRRSFLDGCKGNNLNEDHCVCIFEKLQENVAFDQLMGGKVKQETIDTYVQACTQPAEGGEGDAAAGGDGQNPGQDAPTPEGEEQLEEK